MAVMGRLLDHRCLTVEPLSRESLAESSSIFFEGFKAKFSFSYVSEEARLALITDVWRTAATGTDGEAHFVVRSAADDGAVIAAFGLVSRHFPGSDKKLGHGHAKGQGAGSDGVGFWELARRHGFVNVTQLLCALEVFHYTPKEDELYLSYVSVSRAFQGRGVGHYILNWVVDYAIGEAASASYYRTISLFVTEDNVGARRLYERKGFETVSYTQSWIAQVFAGTPFFSYMALTL